MILIHSNKNKYQSKSSQIIKKKKKNGILLTRDQVIIRVREELKKGKLCNDNFKLLFFSFLNLVQMPTIIMIAQYATILATE